jgi:cholesterol transport system auxiliary component
MKRFMKNLLAITMSITISACSISSKRESPVSHDLGPGAERTIDSATISLDAPVWLWDERIRYRLLYEDATIVRYYHRDRWEAPLPLLLERRLITAGMQPFTLQIQLMQFEQQFEAANSSHVLMSLVVSAFTREDFRLLDKQSFRLSKKTVSPDAAGAIAGFIALIEQAKTDIQIWLETLSDKEISARQP